MPFTILDPALAAAAPAFTGANPIATGNGMDLTAFRSQLVYEMGNRDDLTIGGTDFTRVDRAVNFAYRKIAAMLELPELWSSYIQPLVIDEDLYTVPDGVDWIKRVSVDDSVTYVQGGVVLSPTDLAGYRRLDLATGDLRKWLHYGKILAVWPTPTAVKNVIVDVRVKPVDLTAVGNKTLLGEKWDEAILSYAKAKLFSWLRDFTAATIASNELATILAGNIDRKAAEKESMRARVYVPRSESELLRTRPLSDPAV